MATVQLQARPGHLLLEERVVVLPEAVERQLVTGATQPPKGGMASTSTPMAALFGIGALVAVSIALAILVGAIDDASFDQAPTAAIEGVTIFAVFYVAAQAVERLLEPISVWLLPKDSKETNYTARTDEAANKVQRWASAVGSARESNARGEAEAALNTATDAKKELAERRMERTIVFWALATIVAMWASAALRLYFLKTVGITGAERWLEVLATGLIVGAGTKPLHDLVKRISASSEEAAEKTSKTRV